MQHLISANADSSFRVNVTPESAGWRYLAFQQHSMAAGQTYEGPSLNRELCMVFLSGDARVTVGDRSWSLEGRQSVFAGLPHAVYVPPEHTYRVEALTPLEVAVGFAPAEGRLEPRLITPDDVDVEIRGGHNVTRQISHVIDPGGAEKLLCVEVYTPSGNWSSYPPHRHDVHDPPNEVDLEEIYHYRIQPDDGWAVQRLYTDDRTLDQFVVPRDGDTVLVRRGYHPVIAAPGYDCYYLNFLAGDEPSWAVHDDPQLAWVRDSWEGAPNRLRLPLQGTGR